MTLDNFLLLTFLKLGIIYDVIAKIKVYINKKTNEG